jgi:hypothetical protein
MWSGTFLYADRRLGDRDRAMLHDDLPDGRAQLRLEAVRGLLAAALAGQQLLQVLLKAVLLKAGATFVEVLFELVPLIT